MWKVKEVSELKFFELDCNPRFLIAFTSRIGGVSQGNFKNLNLCYRIGDTNENVRENFSRLKKVFAIERLVKLNQIHSNKIFYVQDTTTYSGDGIFTDQPGLTLSVKVADCLPIYFSGTRSPIIGLCHAGWRGTAATIGLAMVRAMVEKFGIDATDLAYAFGPCISSCCYQVGVDVQQVFNYHFVIERSGRRFFDLKAANRSTLQALGLQEAGSLDYCSCCHSELFYSARRENPTGRNLALIQIKKA